MALSAFRMLRTASAWASAAAHLARPASGSPLRTQPMAHYAHAAVRHYAPVASYSGCLRWPEKIRQELNQLDAVLDAHIAARSGRGVQVAIAELEQIRSLVEQVNAKLHKEARVQALRWALTKMHLVDEFEYCVDPSNGGTMPSKSVLQHFFLAAMQGKAMWLYTTAINPKQKGAHAQELLAAKALLDRSKLREQVWALTGIEPSLIYCAVKRNWAMRFD
jgi:hypothetical protein